MNHRTDRVAAALAALSVFPVTDPDDVVLLLSAWKHRHTLNAADVAAVRAHYEAAAVTR